MSTPAYLGASFEQIVAGFEYYRPGHLHEGVESDVAELGATRTAELSDEFASTIDIFDRTQGIEDPLARALGRRTIHQRESDQPVYAAVPAPDTISVRADQPGRRERTRYGIGRRVAALTFVFTSAAALVTQTEKAGAVVTVADSCISFTGEVTDAQVIRREAKKLGHDQLQTRDIFEANGLDINRLPKNVAGTVCFPASAEQSDAPAAITAGPPATSQRPNIPGVQAATPDTIATQSGQFVDERGLSCLATGDATYSGAQNFFDRTKIAKSEAQFVKLTGRTLASAIRLDKLYVICKIDSEGGIEVLENGDPVVPETTIRAVQPPFKSETEPTRNPSVPPTTSDRIPLLPVGPSIPTNDVRSTVNPTKAEIKAAEKAAEANKPKRTACDADKFPAIIPLIRSNGSYGDNSCIEAVAKKLGRNFGDVIKFNKPAYYVRNKGNQCPGLLRVRKDGILDLDDVDLDTEMARLVILDKARVCN